MREHVLHALDLAMLGDWEGAKRSLLDVDDPIAPRLSALFTEQQILESERSEARAIARHELGNAISIAQITVEGIIDGVLPATPERLDNIRAALRAAATLLSDLKHPAPVRARARALDEPLDLGAIVTSQVALVSGIAEAKNVRIRYEGPAGADGDAGHRGDAGQIAHVLRDILINAVRSTAPGGRIDVHAAGPGDLMITIDDRNADRAGTMRSVLGPQAQLRSSSSHSATFAIVLP